jgi:hypothetical protein
VPLGTKATSLTQLAVLLLLIGGAVAGLVLRALPRACLLAVIVLVGFVAVWAVAVPGERDPECGHTLLNLLPCNFAAGVMEAVFVTALGVGAGYWLAARRAVDSGDDRRD